MRKHFITLSILFTSLLILQACSPSSNVEDTFADVEKVTVEKINVDGSRELLFEVSEQEQLTKGAGTHRVSFTDNFSYMYDAMSSIDIPNKEIIVSLKKGKVSRELINAPNPKNKSLLFIVLSC